MSTERPPGSTAPAKRTRAAATLLVALLTGLAPACSPEPAPAPELPDDAAPGAGEIVVRLAFDETADLDLYVTGPDLESVYFANTPSKLGGELLRDLRCDDPPDHRVEQVRFPNAKPGRYRIGVDFPERCELPARPIPYLIEIRTSGREERIRGLARLGEFEPLVHEFDYDGPR